MKTARLLAVVVALTIITGAQAGRRSYQSGCSGGNCSSGACATPLYTPAVPAPQVQPPSSAAPVHSQVEPPKTDDPLSQVNARRVAAGLRPYLPCHGLRQAAHSAASYRARYRIREHVMVGAGDFQFLPPGVQAQAAGCAAWPPHLGFGACAMYDQYQYAGAASVMGDDGLMYHHLFVR